MRKHDVSTPQWVFNACNDLALEVCGSPLTLDACAARWNAKCPHYFTIKDDALVQDWNKYVAVFVNPPFGKLRLHLFVEKALDAARRGTTVVLVLPQWNYPWYDLCEHHGRIHRIVGPVAFQKKDGGQVVLNNGSHSSPLVVVVFGPSITPGAGPPIRRGERAMSQEQFEKLSQKDQARRSTLERIVDEWSKITFRAAEALHEIKRDRLYRSTHPSFEDYVDDRYGKTRQWAYDLINWYEVNEAAGTKDEPVSSTAARQLKGVKDDPKPVLFTK
jgi:phage N-6-adenine-methyltransferase